MPSQANPNGNVHGGKIMKLMDSAAYAAESISFMILPPCTFPFGFA